MKSAEEDVKQLIADLKAVLPKGTSLVSRLEASFRRVSSELETLRYGNEMTLAGTSPDALWANCHLTPHERGIVGALWSVKGMGISKEGLQAKLYYDRPDTDWPDLKIIDVYVCKLRKKLEEGGANCWIETLWSQGYKIHEGKMPAAMVSGDGKPLFRLPSKLYEKQKDYKRRAAIGQVRPKAPKGMGKWSTSAKPGSFAAAQDARASHGVWKPKAEIGRAS